MTGPSPEELLSHHERQVAALSSLQDELRTRMATGTPHPMFMFLGADQVDATLESMRRELDSQFALMVVAAYEALLMLDANARGNGPRRIRLAREFRTLLRKGNKAGRRVTLEEVLETWGGSSISRGPIGNFKQIYQFRHWLAHGRYFVQRSGLASLDPSTADDRGKALLKSLGLA